MGKNILYAFVIFTVSFVVNTEKKVWLSYNNPNYIKKRHNIVGCDKIAIVLNKLGIGATAK
jgi:hypothetical protein